MAADDQEPPQVGPEPGKAPLITVRWARSRSRRGALHEQLDPSWGFEGIPCVCGVPLDIGLPVRPVALGPWSTDAAADAAHRAGQEHDACALVVHDRCATDQFIGRIDMSAAAIATPREEVEAQAAWHGVDTRFAAAAHDTARKLGLPVHDVVAELGTALELLDEAGKRQEATRVAQALSEPMREAVLRLYRARTQTPPRTFFIGSTGNRTNNVGQVILANTAYALKDRGVVAIGAHGLCALTDTGLSVAAEVHRQWLTDHPAPQLSPPKRGHLRAVTDDADPGDPQPHRGPHG